ncbi:MAG TPA: MbcA/ParS/Xre antitoxin family protein [Anaeromyxobacteraceae bacterium]|nr:MbcA/ParS/Xre antitoxin family protein [Anaeromyxobacteraceae bacterium]
MRKGIRVTVAGSKGVRKRAAQALAGTRYAVTEVAEPELALQSVRTDQPDVLVIQAEAARASLKKIRQASPRTKVLTVHAARAATHLGSADTMLADDLVFAPVAGAELKIRVDRLAEAARATAPRAPTPADVTPRSGGEPLTELHDDASGRIDAKRVAAYLDVPLTALSRAIGKDYKAVFKSPASAALQPLLSAVHRTIVALLRVYGDRARALAWLNTANLELGGARPMELVLDGRAEAVADLVEATLAGVTA